MATNTVDSPLLGLPRELRDLIYGCVLEDDTSIALVDLANDRRNPSRMSTVDERWRWNIQYPVDYVQPAYLALSKTNHQLHSEITELLGSATEKASFASQNTAEMDLFVDYPDVRPTMLKIPMMPLRSRQLDITIRVGSMYHPAYISRHSDNPLFNIISAVLHRYTSRGPYLSRAVPLSRRIHLDTVRITLAPPMRIESITDFYGKPNFANAVSALSTAPLYSICLTRRVGDPSQQIKALTADLVEYMRYFKHRGKRLADAFEVGSEGYDSEWIVAREHDLEDQSREFTSWRDP